jgi:LCP family protein required for cell wall assembly
MAGGEQQSGQKRRRPGRTLLGVVAAVLGVVGAVSLVDLFWARPEQSLSSEEQSGARLADLPTRPITLLLIGSDADRLGAASNGAAPPGPANSDTLLLVRADPAGPMRVLALPSELAVKLPGQKAPQSLGSVYRQGGAALTADTVARLVGLDPGQPERYVVLPRSALRELVDGLGGLELSLDRPMRYRDKAQAYSIDLQGGLQLLKGSQVEQLVRFREKDQGEQGRRERQQEVVNALVQQLARVDQWPQLPERWQRLSSQLDTNLSEAEALSLLAAAVQQPQKIRYDQLPLLPVIRPDQPLRQIPADLPSPLWPRD